MTAIVIHGTAAKIVLVAIYLGLVAIGILLILMLADYLHEKVDDHFERQGVNIHDEFERPEEDLMGRYAYEVHRHQSAEGYIIADSPDDARAKILEDPEDLDWEASAPEDLFIDDRDRGD